MKKVKIADLAKLPYAPKNLISALEGSGKEYWIHERGSHICDFLPSFWSVDKKTGETCELDVEARKLEVNDIVQGGDPKQLKVSISRHQYPCVSLNSTSFDCHKLVALAFVKNSDPENAKSVDHRADPTDTELVCLTKCTWVAMKHYYKNKMCALLPHCCNFHPRALEWVTDKVNRERARTPEHNDYKEKVKDYDQFAALKELAAWEKKDRDDFWLCLEGEGNRGSWLLGYYDSYCEHPLDTALSMADEMVDYHNEHWFDLANVIAANEAKYLDASRFSYRYYIEKTLRTKGVFLSRHDSPPPHSPDPTVEVFVDVLEGYFRKSIDCWSEEQWQDVIELINCCLHRAKKHWHPDLFFDIDFGIWARKWVNPITNPKASLSKGYLSGYLRMENPPTDRIGVIADIFKHIHKDGASRRSEALKRNIDSDFEIN